MSRIPRVKCTSLILGILVGASVFGLFHGSASALTLVSGTGYFYGGTRTVDGDNTDTDVIYSRSLAGAPDAIPSYVYTGTNAQNKANFINWLSSKFVVGSCPSGSQQQDQYGAALIINTILSKPAGSRSTCISNAMWQDVVNRINDTALTVTAQTLDPNNVPNLATNKTSFYSYDCGVVVNGITRCRDNLYATWNAGMRKILLFQIGGVNRYAIEIPCGNPLGVGGLPPSWQLVGTTATSPGGITSVEVGKPLSFTNSIRNIGGSTASFGYGLRYFYSSTAAPAKQANGTYAGEIVMGPLPTSTNATLGAGASITGINGTVPAVTASNAYICGTVAFTPPDSWGSPANGRSTAVCVRIISLGCTVSVTTSAAAIDPYASFTISVLTTISPALSGSVSVAMVGPVNRSYGPTGVAAASPVTTNFAAAPTNTSGHYTFNATYIVSGVVKTCTTTQDITNLPYLAIYNGDAAAGITPQLGGTYTNPAAGIYSWNTRSPNYSGAGAQFGVMALGQIEDFASNLGGNSGGINPAALSFANTGTGAAIPIALSGLFGGNFGTTSANTDFTSDITVPQVSGAVASAAVGALAGGVAGSQVIYANGDVVIANNIIYTNTGSWASINTIPSFKLVVVGGNIYIDKSVTQLDGLYVAEPNGAAGGSIYTCTSLNIPEDTTLPTFYNDCHARLTINGAFAAKQIHFLRTFGSVNLPASSAETFNFTPEMWLPRTLNTVSGSYDSITGLPPVL